MSQKSLTAWYVSRSGAASGPFATDMVLSMLREGQLQSMDLVFREGESEWRPVATYRELKLQNAPAATPATPAASEIKPMERPKPTAAPALPKADPVIETAVAASSPSPEAKAPEARAGANRPLSWIVLRPHSSTYLQEGPFETQTIIDGLQTGRFQFSQYAWHGGMNQWMRIGDLREFDRRSRAREQRPHVPPPLPDPIAAVLLEDDKDAEAEEFHVVMKGFAKLDMTPNPLESMKALNVTKLGSVSYGGAAAESPEDKTAQERAGRAVGLVVSSPNLAGVPWEQDISDGYAQSRELIDDENSGVHAVRSKTPSPVFVAEESTGIVAMPNESAVFDKTPNPTVPPMIPPTAIPMAKDAWDTWGRYVAGTAMLGLFGVFAFHAIVTKPKVVDVPAAAKSQAATAPMKTIEPAAPSVAVAAAPTVAPVVAPPAVSVPSDFGVVGLKLDKPEGQIIVQGSFAPGIPVSVTLKGRLGQILSSMSVRKTVSLERKAGEIPSLRLKDLKLPMGAYTVEVDAGGAKAKNEIFVGVRDAKFLDKLEMHLREISLETQTQKKTLFYAAKELDLLARDLGMNYGQLRGKPETWSTFFSKWSKRVDSVSRSLADLGKKKTEDQAYPEETTSLFQALASLNDVASQYEQAIGQKRDIASDTLTELIAELARQKEAIGETTSRPTADTPDGML